MINTITIISIIVGLILALFGYKIQNVVITLAWFLIGYGISNFICPHFITNEYLIIGINIVIGILLSSVGIKLEKLALVIAVAYLTYSMIHGSVNIGENILNIMVEVVISLVVGGVSQLLLRPIIITVTAGYGSFLIKEGIEYLVPSLNPPVTLVIGIVLVILTIFYQLKTTK